MKKLESKHYQYLRELLSEKINQLNAQLKDVEDDMDAVAFHLRHGQDSYLIGKMKAHEMKKEILLKQKKQAEEILYLI